MNLKHHVATLALCLGIAAMSFSFTNLPSSSSVNPSTSEVVSDYVYVYLKNDCSSSVKYEIKYPGHGSSGSVNGNYKKKMTWRIGGKVYIDGDFFKELTKDDDGKTFTICK